MTTGLSSWRTLGNPDRETFRGKVSRSWDGKGPSPMALEADAVYDVVSAAGLGRLAVAILWHERKNDSWKADYGLDRTFKNPFCMKDDIRGTGGWARYDSYREAAHDWQRRLLSPEGPYAKALSVSDLMHIYAPSFENDTQRYIDVICQEVDSMAATSGTTPTNPFPQPRLWDLSRDYAAFGLSAAEARKLRGNCFPNRDGIKPTGIVLHIQEGTTRGSLAYWARTSGVQASSNVMVQKDGSVLRVIPDGDAPWTNGDVQNPTPEAAKLLREAGSRNVNIVSLTIEAEGYWQDEMPAAQVQAICWQMWEWGQKYGIPLQPQVGVYRHGWINSTSRANCPGRYFDKVTAALNPTPATTTTAPPGRVYASAPDWLPDALVQDLFPEASPGGVRTEAWLAFVREWGRAPRRVKFHYQGTDQELIEFGNGLFIDKQGRDVGA